MNKLSVLAIILLTIGYVNNMCQDFSALGGIGESEGEDVDYEGEAEQPDPTELIEYRLKDDEAEDKVLMSKTNFTNRNHLYIDTEPASWGTNPILKKVLNHESVNFTGDYDSEKPNFVTISYPDPAEDAKAEKFIKANNDSLNEWIKFENEEPEKYIEDEVEPWSKSAPNKNIYKWVQCDHNVFNGNFITHEDKNNIYLTNLEEANMEYNIDYQRNDENLTCDYWLREMGYVYDLKNKTNARMVVWKSEIRTPTSYEDYELNQGEFEPFKGPQKFTKPKFFV